MLPGEGVYLFAERGSVALRGDLYERLAPFLDGTRTIKGLAKADDPGVGVDAHPDHIGEFGGAQRLDRGDLQTGPP